MNEASQNTGNKVTISAIDREEALRYLACRDENSLSVTAAAYLDECEKRLTDVIEGRFLYRYFPLEHLSDGSPKLTGCELVLSGNDISEHLKDCSGAVVMCATIGAAADRLIRILQIEDMAKAVICDALASTAVEKVSAEAEERIKAAMPEKFFTWRYAPGYGDTPIEIQKAFLDVLDAPRKIGLCTGESRMLTPIKSVTSVMGVSDSEIPLKRRGCVACNMKEVCQYRKRGLHCEF